MSHSLHPVIAIDGTAASGKSTFSRRLSQKLGYAYVNTGAMYRGVTWYLQQRGVSLRDPEAIARGVTGATLETSLEKGELAFRIAGIDPLPHVREGKVNDEVSLVAQVAAVRRLLVAEQQRLALLAPLVMEGRDIGTVVFPKTPYKFFLDADAIVRAERRHQQGETDVIHQRDVLDQQRENSPLTCAPDALRLDSSHSSVDELVALALRHLASLGLPAAAPVVPLWNGPAPHSLGDSPKDTPTLTLFLPANASAATPAMIVFPGGGYEQICSDYEGDNEGVYFQNCGVAAFVLKYRLPVHGYRHPVPLLDAQRAVRLVRSHATEWKIDPARVGIMGFSAGGHLAATAATHFDSGDPKATDPVDHFSSRPDYAVLVYAVVSMKDDITDTGSKRRLLGPNPDRALVENLSNETQVTPQTPPTILVHSVDDLVVPIEHSRRMLAALEKTGVPSRLDEYPTGGHGFGYGPQQVNAPPGWLDRVHDWLKDRGF